MMASNQPGMIASLARGQLNRENKFSLSSSAMYIIYIYIYIQGVGYTKNRARRIIVHPQQ